jgi:hypothetical protein
MIPRAISAVLRLPHLTDDLFRPTQWASAEEKAKFGNHLLRFIAEDFPLGLWRNPFYERLSNSFSSIAHYNIRGFWDTWFTTTSDQIAFLENIARHYCFSDAAWTFSDVEHIVKARVRGSGIIDWKRKILAEETKRHDLAEFDRLRKLYDPAASPEVLIPTFSMRALVPTSQLQTDLFGAPTD